MTHKDSLKEVQNIANPLDLIDVWRAFNPDAKDLLGEERNLKYTVA